MPSIKYIVYEKVLDTLLSPGPENLMTGNLASAVKEETQEEIRTFLEPLILEIKNRLPSLPVTRETLNKAPFGIIPVLRHILMKYESLIADSSRAAEQEETHSSEQPVQVHAVTRKRPRKKKSKKKPTDAKKKKENVFVPPRLFSLFPNPSLRWRCIKIDSQNLTGIFPGSTLAKRREETPFEHTQRCFFNYFNFAKLRIFR